MRTLALTRGPLFVRRVLTCGSSSAGLGKGQLGDSLWLRTGVVVDRDRNVCYIDGSDEKFAGFLLPAIPVGFCLGTRSFSSLRATVEIGPAGFLFRAGAEPST